MSDFLSFILALAFSFYMTVKVVRFVLRARSTTQGQSRQERVSGFANWLADGLNGAFDRTEGAYDTARGAASSAAGRIPRPQGKPRKGFSTELDSEGGLVLRVFVKGTELKLEQRGGLVSATLTNRDKVRKLAADEFRRLVEQLDLMGDLTQEQGDAITKFLKFASR